jgi:hypothetical protein
MFILERLISRSSRSLGAMLGTSRKGAGHAQGAREGDCGHHAHGFALRVFLSLPFLVSPPNSPVAPAQGRRTRSFA